MLSNAQLAQLALLEVYGLLFSDQEIDAFIRSAWPVGSHLVPNRIEGAWKALKAAATDTELVALLNSEGEDADLLRGATEDVLHKVTVMLANCKPLGSKMDWPTAYNEPKTGRIDPRVAPAEKELTLWKQTILATSQPATPGDFQRRLEKCKGVVEKLAEEGARMQPLGSGPATDRVACEERVFRGDLASGSLPGTVFFQRRQARRAAGEVYARINAEARAKSRSVGLAGIERILAGLDAHKDDPGSSPASMATASQDSDRSAGGVRPRS
jgi:hypothetical protein